MARSKRDPGFREQMEDAATEATLRADVASLLVVYRDAGLSEDQIAEILRAYGLG